MTKNQHRRRSLKDLDRVIEESIARNPIWYAEIQQIIKEKLKNARKTR